MRGPLAWMAGNSVIANLLMFVFLVGGLIVGCHNIAVNGIKPKEPVDTEGMRYWEPANWSFIENRKCK
jgi:hypothetical protein